MADEPTFKVRLTEPHFFNNTLVPEGAVMDLPESAFSISMEGTDEASNAAVENHLRQALGQVGDFGTGGGISQGSLPAHPIVTRRADGTVDNPPAIVKMAGRAEPGPDTPETTKPDKAKPNPQAGGKPVFPNLDKDDSK